MRILFCLMAISFLTIQSGNICRADDLDDGIGKPVLDDPISKDDELGQADRNVKYLKTRSKSEAAIAKKHGDPTNTLTGKNGDSNMDSVVLGAGSNVKGDIIIIDDSRGNKTQVR